MHAAVPAVERRAPECAPAYCHCRPVNLSRDRISTRWAGQAIAALLTDCASSRQPAGMHVAHLPLIFHRAIQRTSTARKGGALYSTGDVSPLGFPCQAAQPIGCVWKAPRGHTVVLAEPSQRSPEVRSKSRRLIACACGSLGGVPICLQSLGLKGRRAARGHRGLGLHHGLASARYVCAPGLTPARDRSACIAVIERAGSLQEVHAGPVRGGRLSISLVFGSAPTGPQGWILSCRLINGCWLTWKNPSWLRSRSMMR